MTAMNGDNDMPKSYAGRRRPAPRKPSAYGLWVGIFLLVMSMTILAGWAAFLVGALAALNLGLFLVMHIRHAAWIMGTGADQELGR